MQVSGEEGCAGKEAADGAPLYIFASAAFRRRNMGIHIMISMTFVNSRQETWKVQWLL
jgi:hypothetical protein